MKTENILISAIDKVLELLTNCETQDEYIAKFQSCKERLLINSNDEDALNELFILSGPRGYLGDSPLHAKQGGVLSREDIANARIELVELIHGDLEKDA
jgi:hypothetical protein